MSGVISGCSLENTYLFLSCMTSLAPNGTAVLYEERYGNFFIEKEYLLYFKTVFVVCL